MSPGRCFCSSGKPASYTSAVVIRSISLFETMDCFWITCDPQTNRVRSVTKMVLGPTKDGAKVRWDANNESSGAWKRLPDQSGKGNLVLEFSAKEKGWWKKHILRDTGDGLFELLDSNHASYGLKELWVYPEGRVHNNTDNVYLQQFKLDVAAKGCK